ncbi:MAG TPA: hypothetical protein VGZ73_05285 [Bryobacteraceae bacterium]|jgi:hypothetical protein|nr:hypothetical protein [Bryobacteraceae bacterium]
MKLLALCLAVAAGPVYGHVGSPDVFFEGNAGPYRLLITIRPPQVVPGVADIEIRSASPDVRQIHIVPLRLGYKVAQFAPVSDIAQPSRDDPQFYTGALWLMATGSWQVRIDVDGAQGPGRLSVPVPALATRVAGMQKAMAVILIPLALVLCLGLVSIAGAVVRDAMLEPGKQPELARVRRSRIVMIGTALLVGVALWFGNSWWSSEAGYYSRIIFKPLQLNTKVVDGSRLVLQLEDPGWLNRRTDDLLPDHNHLMHLYVIRVPEMDLVWHLHPERGADGNFGQRLPAMPAGRYALYGDVVHANGLGETATAEIELPPIAGTALMGDDAGGIGPPVANRDTQRTTSPLAGGYRMVWETGGASGLAGTPGNLHARQPYEFRFRLEDALGKPADGVELYMGMLGHAAFVSVDRGVFAHVHPSGSAPMPAIQLAQPENPHAAHTMAQSGLPAEVSFPYGFPKPGAYRIFVQMKRAGEIATGVFDADVQP